MKVFVVEDSDAICERIVRMVKEVKDCTVVGTANTVASAIRKINSCLPEAVILDIQLLDGNGLAVLKHVKNVMPAVKVIMLTNFNAGPYRALSQRYGADAFLDKSNDFMQVPRLLQDWQRVTDGAEH